MLMIRKARLTSLQLICCTSLLLMLCTVCIQQASAQSNGLLFLKKQGKTIKTYFPGQDILVYNTGGGAVSGNLQRVTADSLYLVYYATAMVPTMFGTRTPDTLGQYPIQIAIKEIGAVPAMRKRRNVFTSGYTYMIAGGAFLAVNAVNTIREKQPYFDSRNLPRVLGGVAAFVFGYLLEKNRKDRWPVGEKYLLVGSG